MQLRAGLLQTRAVRSSCIALVLSVAVASCASTLDGTAARGADGGQWRDVPPGLNPDGLDPFRPVEAGVITADATVLDAGELVFADATVFDQRAGSLYIGSNSSGSAESSYVSATFRYVAYPDDPRCTDRSAGSWGVYVCENIGMGPVDSHPRPFPNAGEIRVGGGLGEVVIRPDVSGQYTPFYQAGTEFPALRTVRVRAVGTRAVPALDLSFVVPPTVVVTTPTDAVPLVIDRSHDLVVEWVPSAAREVWVVLTLVQTVDGVTRSYRAAVQAYGDVGRAVLPARALAALPVDPSMAAGLTVFPYNVSTTRVGVWPITATVVGEGRRYAVVIR